MNFDWRVDTAKFRENLSQIRKVVIIEIELIGDYSPKVALHFAIP